MASPAPQLLSVGRIDPNPRWYMAAHSHTFWELIIPVAGRMTVRMAGQTFTGEPGDILVYPPGIAHEERSDTQHPVATHFFAFNLERPADAWPLRMADVGGRLRQISAWLVDDRDMADSPAVQSSRQALLELALAHCDVCARHNLEDDRLVRAVRTYVRQHLAEDLALDDLAEVAGLSRFHFLRVYERLAGRPPMGDVRAIRLEHARQLLLTTDLPLKAIAPRCGLGSEFALSRAYKRHFGHNPSSLRRRM